MRLTSRFHSKENAIHSYCAWEQDTGSGLHVTFLVRGPGQIEPAFRHRNYVRRSVPCQKNRPGAKDHLAGRSI